MSSLAQPGPRITGVHWYPYYCPVCEGREQDITPCLCAGLGVITAEQAAGWTAEELVAVPPPPAVRRGGPCADCAARFGSPEQEHDYELTNTVLRRDGPFWCHERQAEVGGCHVYTLTATVESGGEIPIGAQLCAGWWQWLTTGTLPARPYRDLDVVRGRDAARRRGRFEEIRTAQDAAVALPETGDLDHLTQAAGEDYGPGAGTDHGEHPTSDHFILERVRPVSGGTDTDTDREVSG